MGKLINDEWVT